MACVKKRRGKWVVDYRDSDGRRHWETKDDKKAAQDRLAEILKGQDLTPAVDTRTFEQYGNWWLENCAKGSIKASRLEKTRLSCVWFHSFCGSGAANDPGIDRGQEN